MLTGNCIPLINVFSVTMVHMYLYTYVFMYMKRFSRKQTQVLRVKTFSDLIQLIHTFRWRLFVLEYVDYSV